MKINRMSLLSKWSRIILHLTWIFRLNFFPFSVRICRAKVMRTKETENNIAFCSFSIYRLRKAHLLLTFGCCCHFSNLKSPKIKILTDINTWRAEKITKAKKENVVYLTLNWLESISNKKDLSFAFGERWQ